MRWLYTHLEFQCIVLTQHHDYVRGMKPSRQNKAAAGANVCDCEERCLHVCSRLRGGQRGGEVMRFKTTFCTVVLTKNAYGFLHLLRLLYIYIYIRFASKGFVSKTTFHSSSPFKCWSENNLKATSLNNYTIQKNTKKKGSIMF